MENESTLMSSSYLIRVNVDFVLPMTIVYELLTFFSDCPLSHDCDPVINVAVNLVSLAMHCPDLNYLVGLFSRFHHHHQLVQLAIELVETLAYFPMVDMTHQKLLLVFAVVAIAVVQD